MANRRSIDALSVSELKGQLKGCWEHFKRCLAVLNGEKDADGNDIEPCELEELAEIDSDSDDLELFYQCMRAGLNGADGVKEEMTESDKEVLK